MIDLHIHILPGMDDGARTMEEALEMAQTSVNSGVDAVVATPHGEIGPYNLEEYLKRYERTFREFSERLAEEKIPLKLYRGTEWLVNDRLLRCAQNRELPTINGGGYLLVEFYFDASRRYVMSALDRLTEAGYKLILAHPERYDFVSREPECLDGLYRREIILQVDKDSLGGRFSSRAHRTADYMLARGLAGAVGSDAHDPVLRTPDLEETAELLDLYYGTDASKILLEETPAYILDKGRKTIEDMV